MAYGHEEKVFWLIKTFFCGIATILPLFILTSELIAISTSFRYFYTCLTQDLVIFFLLMSLRTRSVCGEPCLRRNRCSKFVKVVCQRKWTAVGVAAVVSWIGIGLLGAQNREFTKDLKDPVPGLSAMGSMQKLDRCWRSLKEFLPRSFPLKVPSSKNVDSHTQPKVKWLSPPNMTCVGQ